MKYIKTYEAKTLNMLNTIKYSNLDKLIDIQKMPYIIN